MKIKASEPVKKMKCGDGMRRELIRQIESGEIPAGERLANSRWLAEKYHISPATVQAELSRLVKSGHLIRRNGIGTFAAEQESWQPIDVIGYLVHATFNPYHLSVLTSVSKQVKAMGAKILVGDALKTEEFIQELKTENCRNLIRPPFWPWTERNHWKLLAHAKINTVIINDFWLDGGPFNCVSSDIAAGVVQMVEHLIGLGHKSIMLMDEDGGAVCPAIFQAFVRTMELNGLNVNSSLIRLDLLDNIVFTENMLDDIYKHCTAVLLTHDYYAIKLAEAFTAAGYVVGKDISIAGIDAVSDTLTTIEHPVDEIIRTALRMLSSGKQGEKVKLPPDCRFRESTAPPNREMQPYRFVFGSRKFQIRKKTEHQTSKERKENNEKTTDIPTETKRQV